VRRRIAGFRPSLADVLVKLGGSLLDRGAFPRIAAQLEEHAGDQRIVVFPGGGPIDLMIEELDRELRFPPRIHHELCARAQDQMVLIFVASCRRGRFFEAPVELEEIFAEGRLAVMLPMEMIVALDVFERTWEITSDSMSAYFADLFDVERFLVLTDVPGIYRPGSDRSGAPEPVVRASELREWGRTSVDECLADFLLEKRLRCVVASGLDETVLPGFFGDGTCSGTEIVPE
jgi:5-(aminomethyl)-3-furanmethanol phosphate kinase